MDRTEALSLAASAASRGITRLCHLTPLRNLLHLAIEGVGLLSLQQLAARDGEYDQQDLERLDSHTDHICCSIEYPNGWYLAQRRIAATPIQRLFPDWACLSINRELLCSPGAKVCVRNAAAEGGALIQDASPEALSALYAPQILGAGGVTRTRPATHIAACPTDDQAEVLIHRAIPFAEVRSVIVPTVSDAKRFHAALDQIGGDVANLRWLVAPTLFDKFALSSAIRRGARPAETPWEPQ